MIRRTHWCRYHTHAHTFLRRFEHHANLQCGDARDPTFGSADPEFLHLSLDAIIGNEKVAGLAIYWNCNGTAKSYTKCRWWSGL